MSEYITLVERAKLYQRTFKFKDAILLLSGQSKNIEKIVEEHITRELGTVETYFDLASDLKIDTSSVKEDFKTIKALTDMMKKLSMLYTIKNHLENNINGTLADKILTLEPRCNTPEKKELLAKVKNKMKDKQYLDAMRIIMTLAGGQP